MFNCDHISYSMRRRQNTLCVKLILSEYNGEMTKMFIQDYADQRLSFKLHKVIKYFDFN